ncbi:fasciclin domain-containing protein [Flavobacterium sp. IB48]|uniref:fasciclin domain-containing protein n=1 Tax=Flavobacterium sp. IB48 TaxID=2779375 RepID=UPI0018E6F687|nr:fasciclin domain-containing protein [Flavobacterium sp. IB48]MBJ2125318.1 fasciclin domain-containing protein [Flavobacterium sp. IB48]
MKNIYNKLMQIAVCVFLVATASSCDNDIQDIGGAQQNYNTAYGLILANTNLTTFAKAIQLAGLESSLNTPDDFTYFVPNNTALDAYLVANGYVNDLGYPDINLVPVDDLKQLVLSHVVKGVKKRVAKLEGIEADYLTTGDYATMANAVNPDLYLLSINVTNNVLKVNGSDKAAPGLDYYGTNGFVNVLDNVIVLTPPAPAISSLSQVLASAGDVITITGQNFVKVKTVKFGSTEATFTAVSNTEIKATVPADFDSYALIVVETEFGVSAPSGIGLKYLLYEDSLKGTGGGWGGAVTWQSTEKVSRGTYSIKKVIGSWEGITMKSEKLLNVADYQFVKMSIFPTESTKIFININSSDLYNSDKGTTVTLVPGQWNNISIPISNLHPELIPGGKFDEILIQEFSNITITPASTIYLDDIGFL